MRKPKLEFDGRPKKMKEHRIPFDQRPKTGEIWCNIVGDPVIITTVNPYGRWYNYERVDLVWGDELGVLKFGCIGQNEIMDGTAFKLDED